MLKNLFRNLVFIGCFLCLPYIRAAGQNYHGLLWEISGNGLKNPSYLFGTIHLTDQRVFQLPDSLLIVLDNCHVFAGELKLNADELNTIQQDLLKQMMMPADTTLKMLLPRNKYKKVKKHVRKKQGVKGLILLNRIKPVYLSLILSETDIKEPEVNTPFLDQHLQQIAADSGLTVTGLETAAEQITALECMSLKKQAEMLVESIETDIDRTDLSEQMIQAYISEDLDSIYAFFSMDIMPKELTEALLMKRNIVMAERMERMIRESPAFVAVGAAHLPAENGIIELLREKGYKVRPVNKKL